jgi:AraC-like DNA-binding protein
VSHRQIFDSLSKSVSFAEAWLVSVMPRGGLQIVQPSHLSESWVKPYSTEFQTEDAATWRSILEGRTVTNEDAWSGGGESSRYFRDFLQPGKLRRMVVAPVKSPVFPGYDGALHVYRNVDQPPFSEHDIKAVTDVAAHLTREAASIRATRLSHGECATAPPWVPVATSRVFVLNSHGKPVVAEGLSDLDERVVEQIHHDARHRIASLSSQGVSSDRIAFPDSRGQNWVFRTVAYRSYPALGSGAFVFYCLTPSFCDWMSVRAADFSADSEVTRLAPAMLFMAEHYRRGPTLGEIAKHVHLSPFHFHRRFTELLGITPKHFQLECQIFHTKRLLFGCETELAEISKVCGFAHQSHFTSRFKQFTGLTPTRWRKLATKGNEPLRGRVEVNQ